MGKRNEKMSVWEWYLLKILWCMPLCDFVGRYVYCTRWHPGESHCCSDNREWDRTQMSAKVALPLANFARVHESEHLIHYLGMWWVDSWTELLLEALDKSTQLWNKEEESGVSLSNVYWYVTSVTCERNVIYLEKDWLNFFWEAVLNNRRLKPLLTATIHIYN